MQLEEVITKEQLSFEQQMIVHQIMKGKNVFITGPAGTGKSFLLKYLNSHVQNLHITATTGVAAVNVGGTTLHSWAGIGDVDEDPMSIAKKIRHSDLHGLVRARIASASVLAIDEISMLDGRLLDQLNMVCKEVRQTYDYSFGGLQLIVFGDFLQLPPVENIERDESGDIVLDEFGKPKRSSVYAFMSNSWQEAEFDHFVLTYIFRQADLKFSTLLNRMRYGKDFLTPEDENWLNQRSIPVPDGEFPVKLFPTNKQADLVNSQELEKIKEFEQVYYAKDKSSHSEGAMLLKSCLAPAILKLKKGARVMLLRNISVSSGLVNGATGTVLNCDGENSPTVKFDNGLTYEVPEVVWEINQGKITIAERSQIALRLSWACTIHKSQGMTFTSALCDVGSVFSAGQTYVAISRVKSYEGLYLSGYKNYKVRAHQQATDFYSWMASFQSELKEEICQEMCAGKL